MARHCPLYPCGNISMKACRGFLTIFSFRCVACVHEFSKGRFWKCDNPLGSTSTMTAIWRNNGAQFGTIKPSMLSMADSTSYHTTYVGPHTFYPIPHPKQFLCSKCLNAHHTQHTRLSLSLTLILNPLRGSLTADRKGSNSIPYRITRVSL